MRSAGDRVAVVTGVAGFLGSHLAEHLISVGWQVHGLDNLATGHAVNLSSVIDHPAFTLTCGSVDDAGAWDDVMPSATHVFHLASAVGPTLVTIDPAETLLSIIRTTQSMLASAERHGHPVLMLASSSEVYGSSPVQPLTEESSCIIPSPRVSRASYALGKASAELLVNSYLRRGEANRGLVVRLFNVVGPRQTADHGFVLPNMLNSALHGDPVVVHGTGEQTRSFSYVTDVVRLLARLADNPRALGQTVNVGSTNEISMNALARLVVDLTGSTSAIVHRAAPQSGPAAWPEVQRRVPDVRLLVRLTGESCTTAPDKIIRLILDDDAMKPPSSARFAGTER